MANRWLIHAPEINPSTFVLFFYKGTTGRSWSIRDYSSGTEQVRYARDYPTSWTVERVLKMADYKEVAPASDVHDVAFWGERIAEANLRYLGTEGPERAGDPPPRQTTSTSVLKPLFPLLDPDVLLSLSKATKRKDIERMYTSPRSEDYVTWTIARALDRLDPANWWPRLVSLADRDAAAGAGLDPTEPPDVGLWRSVPPPPGYEEVSRARMAASANEEWRTRAEDPTPVEGTSEIDVVFSTPSSLVFVEAKLGSDLSPRTTYDPDRNQLIRVIDCVLEEAGDRTPRCWMITADRHGHHLYMQMVATYRRNPVTATSLLAHRDSEDVRNVVDHLAVVTWREILEALPWDLSEPVVADALHEVRRRL